MDRHYTITIEDGGSVTSDSPVAGRNETAKGSAGAKTAIKALVAYNSYVKPFVQPIIENQIQTISLRTGASELQQRIQFSYDLGKSALNIGASILGGYAIGNVPGAVIGALIGVASTTMNTVNKSNTIGYQRTLENVNLQGLSQRAGGYAPSYSGSRGANQ